LEFEPRRFYKNAFIVDEDSDETFVKTFCGDAADQIDENDVFWCDPRTVPNENFWPKRFPPKVVEDIKKNQGPIAFAGMYQQSPISRGGNIIGREHWKLWDRAEYGNLTTIIASLDTSLSSKQMANNDPSALTIWGRSIEPVELGGNLVHGTKLILLWAWQGYEAFDTLSKLVFDMCTAGDGRVIPGCPARFQVDRLLIEDTAAARPVALELERIYGVSSKFMVDLMKVGRLDKVARLQSVEHLFRADMVYAPDKRFADMVVDQMSVFPMGAHDDLVDSASLALRWFRDMNLIATREEAMQEINEQGRYRSKLQPLYPA
jgi:hypothetical protein